jgi:hypothetical protein
MSPNENGCRPHTLYIDDDALRGDASDLSMPRYRSCRALKDTAHVVPSLGGIKPMHHVACWPSDKWRHCTPHMHMPISGRFPMLWCIVSVIWNVHTTHVCECAIVYACQTFVYIRMCAGVLDLCLYTHSCILSYVLTMICFMCVHMSPCHLHA